MRELLERLEGSLEPLFRQDEAREEAVYRRLQEGFREARISEADLGPTVGYAFHNPSLEKLETVYRHHFGTEAALVRPQLVSGTHALSIALDALVVPGARLLVAPGLPYDTLHPVIGIGRPTPLSLEAKGAKIIVPRAEDVLQDPEGIALQSMPDVVLIQRSRGYARRPSLQVEEIGRLAKAFSGVGATVLVDNCYGEFVEVLEPSHVGATVVVGSLIKNPGGTLAPGGSYVVGTEAAVSRIASRLFGPALGRAPGPVPEGLRSYVQGLFLAPHLVSEAVQTSRLAAALFQALGYPVDPAPEAGRGDIVLRVEVGGRDPLVRAVHALQRTFPVDGYARPEPAVLPGYRDPVLMASAGFVPGATLELSADAPLREPYDLFLQGGVSRPQSRVALLAMAEAMGAREEGKSS